MRIRIDDAACMGHGSCYTLFPSLFTDDDWGRAVVVHDQDLAANQLDDARRAVGNCPEQAISLEGE